MILDRKYIDCSDKSVNMEFKIASKAQYDYHKS